MQPPPLTTLSVDRQIYMDPASKNPHPDDSASLDARLVLEKLADALTPGFQAEFDPGEADIAGAFDEDALSESDALASMHDAAPSPASPVAVPFSADRGRAGT